MSKSLRKIHANNWSEEAYKALMNENLGFFKPLCGTVDAPEWGKVLQLRCPPGAATGIESQLGYLMWQHRDTVGQESYKQNLHVILAQMRPPLNPGGFVFVGRDYYQPGLHMALATYYNTVNVLKAKEEARAKQEEADRKAAAEACMRSATAPVTFTLKLAHGYKSTKPKLRIDLTPKIEALVKLQGFSDVLCDTEGAQLCGGYTLMPQNATTTTFKVAPASILPTWPSEKLARKAIGSLSKKQQCELRVALRTLVKA